MDRRAFWEQKILGWEAGRYRQGQGEPGLLNRIADWSSDSLRFRLQYAVEVLAPHVQGARVLDLGCGSGLLAEGLLAAGAASYTGVDLADNAIARATARVAEAGLSDRAHFRTGGIVAGEPYDADVVVSLGLTDWLTDAELEVMYERSGAAHFLHAFAERQASPVQWAHRAYCWSAYGWRNGGYVPRYFELADVASRIRAHHDRPVQVLRHRRLTFGTFLTSLPMGDPL